MVAVRPLVGAVVCCAIVVGAACAPRRIVLPSGDGTPAADATVPYNEAVANCRHVRTISASLGLSGRAGATPLRGNVDAGFEAPDRVRLEGRHPFGRPVFILVATGPDATLVLPRDNRVLQGVRTAEIVEALVGLPLGAAELRVLLSGCAFEVVQPADGREYPGGWLAVSTAASTTYLRRVEGLWRVVAATRPPLTVHYGDFEGGRAATVRLQSTGATPADVTARVSDLTINAPLEPAVFEVAIPPDADPLTIDELRRAGPLGDR
jgi:hypothetical protein